MPCGCGLWSQRNEFWHRSTDLLQEPIPTCRETSQTNLRGQFLLEGQSRRGKIIMFYLCVVFVFPLHLSSMIPLNHTWKIIRKAPPWTELLIFILLSWRVLDVLSFFCTLHCQGVETFTIHFKWQMSPTHHQFLFSVWPEQTEAQVETSVIVSVFSFSQEFHCSEMHRKATFHKQILKHSIISL